MKLYEHYVQKNLGHGGFGSVDLVIMANGPLKGEKLALKTVKIPNTTEEEKQKAVDEAKNLQRSLNPHIVRFFHAWWEKENEFKIVLELCEDGTLNDAIDSQEGKHFEDLQIIDWSSQLAVAIKYLHDRKIIHRDIKPRNIFLCRNKTILKLGDFGLLKLFETTSAYTNARAGTANYMSPEIHNGENYNYPADVWAFACVLYELTNLKMAFIAKNRNPLAVGKKIDKNEYQKFERNFCKDLILKCFQNDQRARPTIAEILDDLSIIQKELEQIRLGTLEDFDNLSLTGKSTSMLRGDESKSFVKMFQNVLSCSNSDYSEISNFQTSASCLYEHQGMYPRLLRANNDSFCSFGWHAKDAFLCDLTSDGHSKTEIGDTVCATLRSDGKIVTGNKKGEVFLWSNNQKLLSQKIHDEPVHYMCSLSENKVFTTSPDGTAKVLGPILETISQMERSKTQVDAIGNYGNKVATGDYDGIIRYYDLNEESQPKILSGHSDAIWSISLDKNLIASGSRDYTVALWKPSESDQPVFVMKHDHWVRKVIFGREASSNKLHSCSDDETTAIWNIETGQKLSSISHPGPAWCLDIHPDGHLAATGHHFGVSLLDIRVPKIVKEIIGHPDGKETKTHDIKFSQNGKRIVFTESQGAVKILDLRY